MDGLCVTSAKTRAGFAASRSTHLDWTDHPDYQEHIQRAKEMAHNLDSNLAKPDDIAKVIFKAATDPSNRLRYFAKPGIYVALYKLLPDGLWRGMIQFALNRHAKQT